MGRTLFIGDSHTMGYKSTSAGTGLGSFSQWNDNNYAEIYSELAGRPVVIYALSGATNRLYTKAFVGSLGGREFVIREDSLPKENKGY